MFRKALLYIRKNYNAAATRKKFLIIWGILALVGVAAGVVVDLTLPFDRWWNFLRTAVLAVSAISIFVLSYSLSLFLHYRKVRTDYAWEPYRMRMSPSWRRRIALIAGTVGLVFVIGNGMQPGYTFISTMFVVLIIALFAYIRPTKAEARREALGVPDVRDTNYEHLKRSMEAEREKEEALKARRKEFERSQRKKTRKQRREDQAAFDEEMNAEQ